MSATANGSGRHIVWIDDDTDIIDPVVRPLEVAGYQFQRFGSAAEALTPAAIEQMRAADLIMVDMILPPGTTERKFSPYPGHDILRELREVYGVATPALILSVVTNEDLLRQVEALSAVAIVRKPIRPSQLKERVEAILAGDEAGT